VEIFLSWAGQESKRVAEELRAWLPSVIQATRPWMSSEDIGKGERWNDSLATTLRSCQFAIICLTREAAHSPWVMFEAGALAISIDDAQRGRRVTPLLVGLKESDIPTPLVSLQATKLDHDDILRLVTDVNSRLAVPLESEVLLRTFELWWPKLQSALETIQFDYEPIPDTLDESDVDNIDRKIELILASVRNLERAAEVNSELSNRFLDRLTDAELSSRLFRDLVTKSRGERVGQANIQPATLRRSAVAVDPVYGDEEPF
jgi:TIR domain